MKTLIILLLAIFGVDHLLFAQTDPQSFKVLTYNLHGYHPTDQPLRYVQDQNGSVELSSSDIYYFNWQELVTGHQKRIEILSTQLREIAPDIIFFQEVGAGGPQSIKNCNTFYDPNTPFEIKNSAQKIIDAIKMDYSTLLACRGNVGWITDNSTFKSQRILKKNQQNQFEIVFDFNSNPYPAGIIVEGLAIGLNKRFSVLESWNKRLQTFGEESFFVQFAKVFDNKSKSNLLIVNVHAGHKLRNFEQQVALSLEIQNLNWKGSIIVAGDFNAFVLDQQNHSELSLLPWFKYPDFEGALNVSKIQQTLLNNNDDLQYKKWASIPEPEAQYRVQVASKKWLDLSLNQPAFNEALLTRCLPDATRQGSCHDKQRIDFIFASTDLGVEQASLLYSKNDWIQTQSTSDHPALYGEFKWPRSD